MGNISAASHFCPLPSTPHSDDHITCLMQQITAAWGNLCCTTHFVAIFVPAVTILSMTSPNPLRHGFLIVRQVAHPLFKMSPILIATSEANPNCEGVQSVTLKTLWAEMSGPSLSGPARGCSRSAFGLGVVLEQAKLLYHAMQTCVLHWVFSLKIKFRKKFLFPVSCVSYFGLHAAWMLLSSF